MKKDTIVPILLKLPHALRTKQKRGIVPLDLPVSYSVRVGFTAQTPRPNCGAMLGKFARMDPESQLPAQPASSVRLRVTLQPLVFLVASVQKAPLLNLTAQKDFRVNQRLRKPVASYRITVPEEQPLKLFVH